MTNLSKKKALATRTFNVGAGRIVFVNSRIDDIKEAITRKDLIDLKNDGAIIIKPISGRKTVVKKVKRRTVGNVRKRVNKSKQEYVKVTRKLRNYAREMRKQGRISPEELKEIRKKIRSRNFRSLANLKEHLGGTN